MKTIVLSPSEPGAWRDPKTEPQTGDVLVLGTRRWEVLETVQSMSGVVCVRFSVNDVKPQMAPLWMFTSQVQLAVVELPDPPGGGAA